MDYGLLLGTSKCAFLETRFISRSPNCDYRQLKVLRTLVELQLSHSSEIKKMIDAAWRVARALPKKKDPANEPDNGPQLEDLQLLPIGQDLKRKRYWVVDGEHPFRCHSRRFLTPPLFLCRFSSNLYVDEPMEDEFDLGGRLFFQSGI